MIWFSADSAPICTSPSACGPIAMPVTRNTATSGILIFCASRLASVPIARMRPEDRSVCFAISMEADASNQLPIVDVNDPARLRMVDHHAVVYNRIMVARHAVALRHGIGFVTLRRQLPADHDFFFIAVGGPVLPPDIFPQRLPPRSSPAPP